MGLEGLKYNDAPEAADKKKETAASKAEYKPVSSPLREQEQAENKQEMSAVEKKMDAIF
jgi:hypothetical protein